MGDKWKCIMCGGQFEKDEAWDAMVGMDPNYTESICDDCFDGLF